MGRPGVAERLRRALRRAQPGARISRATVKILASSGPHGAARPHIAGAKLMPQTEEAERSRCGEATLVDSAYHHPAPLGEGVSIRAAVDLHGVTGDGG